MFKVFIIDTIIKWKFGYFSRIAWNSVIAIGAEGPLKTIYVSVHLRLLVWNNFKAAHDNKKLVTLFIKELLLTIKKIEYFLSNQDASSCPTHLDSTFISLSELGGYSPLPMMASLASALGSPSNCSISVTQTSEANSTMSENNLQEHCNMLKQKQITSRPL